MAAMVVSEGRSAELARTANTLPMRGMIEGLINPRPFGPELPALLQDDEFCMRFVQAFDDAFAPLFATLDSLWAYFDTQLAPEDFLDWLSGWVGVEVDENWTLERRRQLIHEVAALYRLRGTSIGLAAHIQLYAGVAPEIDENGGCLWSQTADTPLPGAPDPYLSVRLRVPDPSKIQRRTLEGIVGESRPAHLIYSVEIQTSGGEVIDSVATDEAEGAADAPGAVSLPGSESIDLAPPGPEEDRGDEESVPGPEAPEGKEPSE